MPRSDEPSPAREWNGTELASMAMALGLTVTRAPLDPQATPPSLLAWVERGAIAAAGGFPPCR
ncbi:hypothetical protein JYK14_26790 [Siccirubricoccus sp. KC 17139]|uniref:Uncharacterized protein n=1 Tax=Siccirubricoccus soli TaxID=2899147 RepID=A0ABT1DEV5_9PROT|nr:hypothetical protein [Siccirubricoccus soli]MCO6419744.1 hypothetical protein [Siccirubricoccus soli]MCP2685879.1 hypothetical protein [Siccirubricoccus soli]